MGGDDGTLKGQGAKLVPPSTRKGFDCIERGVAVHLVVGKVPMTGELIEVRDDALVILTDKRLRPPFVIKLYLY